MGYVIQDGDQYGGDGLVMKKTNSIIVWSLNLNLTCEIRKIKIRIQKNNRDMNFLKFYEELKIHYFRTIGT